MSWLASPRSAPPDEPFVSDMPHRPVPVEHVHHVPERFGEPTRITDAARHAYHSGHEWGHRSGYIEGMHWGMAVGAIAGALLVCLVLWARSFIWPALLAWLSLP